MDEALRQKLVELVPEIGAGTVEVVRFAQKLGFRTKLAVRSNDPEVDPVGAIVGPNGSRIRALVTHLRGDAIDVIPYFDDPPKFAPYAVAPAKVDKILVSDGALLLVVADEDFDRLVGPDGANLQLVAQIVGLRLDLVRRSTAQARAEEARRVWTALGWLTEAQVEALVRVGLHSPADLQAEDGAWLAEVLKSEDVARRLLSG